MTRDERQELARDKWIASKCRGTFVMPTGFGKTRSALGCIKTLWRKHPEVRILIVVPTDNLKVQWQGYIDSMGLTFNCTVEIINTVIKHNWEVDMLCIDEIHITPSRTFKRVFECVKYKLILGLTATFERLDGKEVYITQYCPIVDTVSLSECLSNHWISSFIEYQVLLDVDLEEYRQYTKAFNTSFGYFNYDWNIASQMVGKEGFRNRAAYRDHICPNGSYEEKLAVFREVTYHATSFMRSVQQRKKFINNHPRKIEVARQIINARPFSKIITFSNNIQMAESIGIGNTYTGKDSKKRARADLEEFNAQTTGVINSCKKLCTGADIKGLSVAIMLGIDSSELNSTQKRGRAIRFEEGKTAEIFNLVINDTVEVEWMRKSHRNTPYITIDKDGLEDVLAGRTPKPYVKKIRDFTFRY